MLEKLLSISVAAYNVEKFIRQTLDSFVDSGVLDDIEVLVTDDGSSDSTPDIVSEYEAKYPDSIKLIRQANAGPGSTVNSGIRHATGRYFRMVDGDDWVDPVGFAALVNDLRTCDADMVINDYNLVDNDTDERVLSSVEGVEAGRVMPFSEFCRTASVIAMHNTIYKTSILKDNSIELYNGFYTDTQYLYFPMQYVSTVVYLPHKVYMYRISLSTQSVSVSSMQRNIAMHEQVLDSLIDMYEQYKSGDSFDEHVGKYLAARISTMAGTQMGVYLSFKPSAEYKARLHRFISQLKARSADIYANFSRLKTARVLRLPLTYSVVSRLHRIKIKA